MFHSGILAHDLRVAFRVLSRNRTPTGLSILSIGIAIGFAVAIFTIADAQLLRPFPFTNPAEIQQLSSRGDDGKYFLYSWLDFEDLRREASDVAEFSAYQRRGSMLGSDDESRLVMVYPVTANHFSFLGIHAALGRASLEPVDGRPTVVLGDRLWHSRFGADPTIVGRSIRLNGQAFLVSGVLPPNITGVTRMVPNDVWLSTDAWFAVLGGRDEMQGRVGQFEVLARLKPGVSPAVAAERLDRAIRGPGKRAAAPAGSRGTILEQPFTLGWKRQLTAGAALLPVLALILFIGCANASQLRLAQVEARKSELTVRHSLGAGAASVTRMLLVETGIVCALGAGCGLLAALAITRAVTAAVASIYPVIDPSLRVDGRALLVAVAAAVGSVLLAGLAPARRAARLNLSEVLKSAQVVAGRRAGRWKQALVIGQLAATILFFGMAVLLVENARNAAAVRPAIDPHKQVLVMNVSRGLPMPNSTWSQQAAERLAGLPGVRAATYARRLPLSGSGGGLTARIEIPGSAPRAVALNNVAGNYFAVMGTRVFAGRGIDATDRKGGVPVAVISQQFRQQVLSGRNALGEWITIDGIPRQVVGIAEDGPTSSPSVHEAPAPYLYLPFSQAASGDLALMIETAGTPESLEPAIRAELKRFDPGVTVISTTTLRRHLDQALLPDRIALAFAACLGLVGILLTASGLFGVIQYSVNARTREIGLRVALGAEPAGIRRMILGDALRLVRWGLPLGLALLAAAAHTVRSFLVGVPALDPVAYATSAAAAIVVTGLAAWLPAVRAAAVDPMIALRNE